MQSSPTISVAALRVSAEARRHLDRAASAAAHNRMDEADRESAKALQIEPKFAEAYIFRASQQLSLRNYDRAIGEAEAALRIDSRVNWGGVILAAANNGLRRYNDARLELDLLRGFEGDTWQAKYERARAEVGLGNIEASLLWSSRALAAAPSLVADAHLLRANALLLARRWIEARDQMLIYLESKGSQEHRSEVLEKLATIRNKMVDDPSLELAAR